MKDKKVLVVIPARGGSKGIPRKNIRLMAGKPLISYAIQNAVRSRYSPDVVVSTDDDEIAWVSKKFGAEVIMRPDNLASDQVTLDPVVFHAVEEAEGSRQNLRRGDYDAADLAAAAGENLG